MENRNPQLQRAIKVLGARQRQHAQAVTTTGNQISR